jgi:FeS assembly protein IscX
MHGDEWPKPLYWEASYEIVLELMERYPGADLDSVGLQQLFEWIIALPGFADDPALANDGLLTAILREWYEEQCEAS